MDYELKLRCYANEVQRLHCACVRGKRILAKPILIKSIEDNIIFKNEFPWGRKSEFFLSFKRVYEDLFRGYLPNEYQTPIFKPFFHLKHEGFWHLKRNMKIEYPKANTVFFLYTHIKFAYLDEQLWQLLKKPNKRNYQRDIVVNNYLC